MQRVVSMSLFALVVACGAGRAGDAVRPETPTASKALGEASGPSVKACSAAPAEPLIVDLKSAQRTDLDAAMKEAIAVVAYDCKSFRHLKDCKVHGRYAFVGVERNEDVVRLNRRDELAANFPVTAGVGFGSTVQSGSMLELALVTVGKRRASMPDVSSTELVGSCEGATHVVRGAYVGAFALGTGTVGKVRAAAEIFNVGAKADSASEREGSTKSGDLDACQKSTPAADAAPTNCGAMTRLELLPLTPRAPLPPATPAPAGAPSGQGAGKPQAAGAVLPTCPDDFVWTGSACSATASKDVGACTVTDPAKECRRFCDQGSRLSCEYAFLAATGYKRTPNGRGYYDRDLSAASVEPWSPETDPMLAATKGCKLGSGFLCRQQNSTLARGCDLGDSPSCYAEGISKPEPEKARLIRRACELGSAEACGQLAQKALDAGDFATAVSFFDRGCSVSSTASCMFFGELRLGIERYHPQRGGVPRDEAHGMGLLKRGCDYGDPFPCGRLARYLLDAKKDATKAFELARASCAVETDSPYRKAESCVLLGQAYENGLGTTKDLPKAVAAYERAAGDDTATERVLALLEAGGPGLSPDPGRVAHLHGERCVYHARKAPGSAEARSVCQAAEARVAKTDNSAQQGFYRTACESGVGPAACTKYLALAKTPDDKLLEALKDACENRRLGIQCRSWKAVGGAPTRAQLALPDAPSEAKPGDATKKPASAKKPSSAKKK